MKLIEKHSTYRLEIPFPVLQNIKEWCIQVPDNEWSGTLFYTVEGSFEDKSLKIICRDFYVMDIGTSAYTEVESSAEALQYQVEHDLLDCYSGWLHSHNRMASFFSGTDSDTLVELGSVMPHFLSLIVNNKGEYVAKITRKIKKESPSVTYDTFGGKSCTEADDTVEEYIEAYSLVVDAKNTSNSSVLDRVRELMKGKEDKEMITADSFSNPLPKPVQPSIPELPVKTQDDEEHVTEACVSGILAQILSGSIFYKEIDEAIKYYILPNIDSIYIERFKTENNLYNWIDFIVDYLVYNNGNTSYEYTDLLIKKLLKRLNEIPYKSKVIDVIIDKLKELLN